MLTVLPAGLKTHLAADGVVTYVAVSQLKRVPLGTDERVVLMAATQHGR